MKTEMTEYTATKDGTFTATWTVTLTPQEEAAYWKAKYERLHKDYLLSIQLVPWIAAIAFVEALAIVYLLVR